MTPNYFGTDGFIENGPPGTTPDRRNSSHNVQVNVYQQIERKTRPSGNYNAKKGAPKPF